MGFLGATLQYCTVQRDPPRLEANGYSLRGLHALSLFSYALSISHCHGFVMGWAVF